MRKVYISKTDTKIFGVCGGIGKAFDIDPNLIRLICVFLCIVTAVLPAVLTYIAAWIIFPAESMD